MKWICRNITTLSNIPTILLSQISAVFTYFWLWESVNQLFLLFVKNCSYDSESKKHNLHTNLVFTIMAEFNYIMPNLICGLNNRSRNHWIDFKEFVRGFLHEVNCHDRLVMMMKTGRNPSYPPLKAYGENLCSTGPE